MAENDMEAVASHSNIVTNLRPEDGNDVEAQTGGNDLAKTQDSQDAAPADNEQNEQNEENKKEEDEDQEKVNAMLEDDPMHVDFNENQWLPCIPGLSLTAATLICAIIGAGIGLVVALTMDEDEELDENWMAIIEFPGKLWVNALKLLVMPLLILIMIVLPSRVDDFGFMGKRAIPLLLFTSTCASIEGTIWAWIIQPGNQSSSAELSAVTLSSSDITPLGSVFGVFYKAVPSNIVAAMADNATLGVILFFILVGILLKEVKKEEEKNAVLYASRALLRCVMKAIVFVVWWTPIGMMSLICLKLATTTNLADLLAALGFYVLTVIIGHTIHIFLVYPAIFYATTRGNGWKFFAKIYPAPLLAFATSSSAATLPRSLQVAHKAGVTPHVYQFILPLGSAINMDGTALGFPIMIALIAQMNNVSIDVGSIFIVLILSVVISVGTAPIPNAGMVYLTMLFAAVGLDDYTEDGIATLFILDWLVDRIETAVNVTSDQFVAKIIDDAEKNASKKEVNIVCGCCIGGTSKGYEAPQDQITNNKEKVDP